MALSDRINHPDRRTDELAPIVERRGGTERRVPAWVERMQRDGLPPKDMTGRAA
jgi:hypothetical protein